MTSLLVAVYNLEYRIPWDLTDRGGMVYFHWSLHD